LAGYGTSLGPLPRFLLVWPVRGRFIFSSSGHSARCFRTDKTCSESCLYILRQRLVTIFLSRLRRLKLRRNICRCAQMNSTSVCCTFQWKWRPHIRKGLNASKGRFITISLEQLKMQSSNFVRRSATSSHSIRMTNHIKGAWSGSRDPLSILGLPMISLE